MYVCDTIEPAAADRSSVVIRVYFGEVFGCIRDGGGLRACFGYMSVIFREYFGSSSSIHSSPSAPIVLMVVVIAGVGILGGVVFVVVVCIVVLVDVVALLLLLLILRC